MQEVKLFKLKLIRVSHGKTHGALFNFAFTVKEAALLQNTEVVPAYA